MATRAATPRYLAIDATVACTGCAAPIALPGLVPEVTCAACGTALPLPESFWVEWLDELDTQSYRAEPGRGGSVTRRSTAHGSVVGRWQELEPTCHRCRVAVPPVEPDSGAAAACLDCGATLATARAPGYLRRALPTAQQLYFPVEAAADSPAASPAGSPLPTPRTWWLLLLGTPRRLLESQTARRDATLEGGGPGVSPLSRAVQQMVDRKRKQRLTWVLALFVLVIGGLLLGGETLVKSCTTRSTDDELLDGELEER